MIRWFAHHPTAANILMAVLLLAGLATVPNIQRETFPEVENDKVEIRLAYPGATPADVEDAICRRIEEALEGIADLDEIRCEARENLGVATAVMREGRQMQRFLDEINAEIDGIDNFPTQVETPVITELGRTNPVVSVAVTGPKNPVHLKDYAEALKDRLQRIEQIAEIVVEGFSEHQLRIEVSPDKLRQLGLSAAQLASLIQKHNIDTPLGKLEGGSQDMLLRFDDRRKTVAELEQLVVLSSPSGASLRLGQIATISDRFELDEEKILFNGQRAAILNIRKTSDQDVLEVYDAVAQFIADEQARAPPAIKLALTQDQSSLVRDRLEMLLRNGYQGLIGVFLVLWLFFNIRYSFWVTMGLPVSFLGAMVVLPQLGITINMISMVGLLIGIGLLMDDAIVIAENIAARLRKGSPPIHAAIDGAKEVLPGVMMSFATTIMVFGSLTLISGEIGQILRIIPIVLIVVISISLFEAFWILPNHLGHSLKHTHQRAPSRFRQSFENGFDTVREKAFAPLLDRAIEYRYLTLGLVLMLLLIAASMPAAGVLKFVSFPELDGDVGEARILLPQGTPLARTEQIVAQLNDSLKQVNKEFSALQADGREMVKNVTVIYGQNPDAFETGPHVARIVIDLIGAETRSGRLDAFLSRWRELSGDMADVITVKYTESSFAPGGKDIDLRLIGEDLTQLKTASIDMQTWFKQYQGVYDVTDDLRPGKQEFHLRLKPAAGTLGLDAQDVADQVRAAFQGIVIDEFPVASENYELELRLSAANRSRIEDLQHFTITGRNGAAVPLPVVAHIEPVRGWARIHRIDGRRAITVQGDVNRHEANAQELVGIAGNELFPQIEQNFPGVRIALEGESHEFAKTRESLMRNVAFGLIGVYLMLALQLRGYLAPITVMLVIPTAFIGVIAGHMALGLDMTMPSIVGMASLFGVVVNDSILLVIFIRNARSKGMAVIDAAKDAGRARFRPILLTSITTVAGLTPLLFETSLQAQILIPLATSLAFGLTVATIAALFLVPAIYCILDDFNALGALGYDDDDETEPQTVRPKESLID